MSINRIEPDEVIIGVLPHPESDGYKRGDLLAMSNDKFPLWQANFVCNGERWVFLGKSVRTEGQQTSARHDAGTA